MKDAGEKGIHLAGTKTKRKSASKTSDGDCDEDDDMDIDSMLSDVWGGALVRSNGQKRKNDNENDDAVVAMSFSPPAANANKKVRVAPADVATASPDGTKGLSSCSSDKKVAAHRNNWNQHADKLEKLMVEFSRLKRRLEDEGFPAGVEQQIANIKSRMDEKVTVEALAAAQLADDSPRLQKVIWQVQSAIDILDRCDYIVAKFAGDYDGPNHPRDLLHSIMSALSELEIKGCKIAPEQVNATVFEKVVMAILQKKEYAMFSIFASIETDEKKLCVCMTSDAQSLAHCLRPNMFQQVLEYCFG